MTGIALAASLVCTGPAWALGLGRLNVQSALGETLRAEIEVSSMTPEEASSLKLRVAPAEAYRAAGLEFNAALSSAQVQVVRRPDGRSVLRVTNDRAVLEPFVELIVEATWSSGRLVREYTMLFDPPGMRVAQAPVAPVTAPVVTPPPVAAATPPPATAPVAPPAVTAAAPMTAPPPAAVPTPAPRPPRPSTSINTEPAPRQPMPATASAAGADEVQVRSGDTLSRIASRTQRQGVSLDQMLVSLFRANPQAFSGDNMNRLKSGSVLSVPAAGEVAKTAPQEARGVISAQSADFAAYRQRLASGTTTRADAAPARQDTGRVQTQVEDRKQPAAATPDKLTLSRGAATAPEAKASNDTERKDSNARLAELARNVDELKKLQGATGPAAGTPAAASPAAAPAAPTIVAAAPSVPPVPATAPAPAPAPAPVPAPPAPPPAPLPTPAAAPSSGAASPPSSQEPGLLASLSDNPLLLPGAAVLVLLLGGLGLYKLRARGRKAPGETSFLESRLQPDSFFGASGGQRIDTRDAGSSSSTGNSSSMSYSLSQLDAIGDVDPVAEADVYLAYGRDLQAEEILKEAMRADPERMAVRTKLLEVYAKRRDTKGFELLATQLFSLTQGSGEDWAKAQTLGHSIDPGNVLYQPGGAPDEVLGAHGQPVEALSASTVPYTAPAGPPVFQPAADATLNGQPDVDLSLDLELPGERTIPVPVSLRADPHLSTLPVGGNPATAVDLGLDFDPEITVNRSGALTTPGALEVTTPVSPPRASARAPAPPLPPAQGLDEGLDFDLGEFSGDTLPPKEYARESAVDFGDFSIDGTESRPLPLDESSSPTDADADVEALSRKLELAEEFRQIGDLEGARDLLEEVMGKADGALRSKAQKMLESL